MTNGLRSLRTWCRDQRLELTDQQMDELSKYLKILKIWARRISLVAAAEIPLLAQKHLADCLYAAAHCPDRGRAADLGSGAGLPGIPIAIARPELQMDLIETTAKKVSFLSAATATVANAKPLHKRIEDLGQEANATYDLAVARALAPLERLLPLARPILRPSGTFLAMKAVGAEKELAAVNLQDQGFAMVDLQRYMLPTGESRVLVELRRTESVNKGNDSQHKDTKTQRGSSQEGS